MIVIKVDCIGLKNRLLIIIFINSNIMGFSLYLTAVLFCALYDTYSRCYSTHPIILIRSVILRILLYLFAALFCASYYTYSQCYSTHYIVLIRSVVLRILL